VRNVVVAGLPYGTPPASVLHCRSFARIRTVPPVAKDRPYRLWLKS
jgi:hypothetical protein